MPSEKAHVILSSLVKEVKTHHTTSCRKKGVTCWYSASRPPSERISIVCGGRHIDKTLLKKVRMN